MPTPRPTPPSLLERLRAELSAAGATASRARLSALIEAGAARVAGRVVRDPQALVAPDERVTFDPEDADSDAISGALAPRSKAVGAPRTLPAGVYFADRHLVVVERSAFAQDAATFVAQVTERLGGAGGALLLVPDPTGPGSGPVLLARSAAGVTRLTQQIRAGDVLECSLCLRSPPDVGPSETLLEVLAPGQRPQGGPATGLVQRDDAPLAPPPAGTRHLQPPARAELTLRHPRTNRRLTFHAATPGPDAPPR